MALQDATLIEAQSNLQRMSVHAEQAADMTQFGDAQSHLQDAIRFGEQTRGYLEEALDSTDEESVILSAEQSLDALEEAMDQANQAIFASEENTREHIEQMRTNIEQAIELLGMLTEIEIE